MNLCLAAGRLVCGLGISDFLCMDLLGFKENMVAGQKSSFVSFIGNINTYTALVGIYLGVSSAIWVAAKKKLQSLFAYVCVAVSFVALILGISDNAYLSIAAVFVGVSSAIWVAAKKKLQSLFAYVCVAVSFVALILGISDNAYLSIAAVFGLLPLLAFRSRRGLRRYVVLAATFFTSLKGIEWIQNHYTGEMLRIHSVYNQLVAFGGLKLLILLLWGLAAGLYLWDYVSKKKDAPIREMLRIHSVYNQLVAFGGLKLLILLLWGLAAGLYLWDYVSKKKDAPIRPWLSWSWVALMAACVAVLVYMLYDVNIGDNGARYGSLEKYLLFNDAWGTNRGYIWKLAFRDYKEFSPIHKLFGLGPDTFGLMTYFTNYDEMINTYNVIFDSAHNEYIHYFVTMGPFGFLSYLVILGGAVVSMVKKCFHNPYVMGALLGVLCYVIQALVNINQPIATPVMWTLLCMGMAAVREKN